jgi:uncharacterized RDD family membrane protein YckC
MECPFCQRQTTSYLNRCKHCGKTIPPSQHLLEESGIIEPVDPADSVAATGNSARPQPRYRFARLGDRFIAFVLDTAFLFGLFAIVDAWALMRWSSVEGAELRITVASLLVAITLNAALLFLYGWILEALWGATLGKAMVGIRVVGSARHRSFSACAVRNVLRIIDGLGFYLIGTIVAACSSVRQRIGDIYAGTAVIEQSFGIGIRVLAISLCLLSLGAAGWAVPRICSIDRSVPPPILSGVIMQVGRNETSTYFQVGGLNVHVELSSSTH